MTHQRIGGRYVRDPKTKALRPVEGPALAKTKAAAPARAPAPDAGTPATTGKED